MTTQIVAKPQGMVTEPNKVGQFAPGAFANCRNVAIRSFGVLEQVRKFADVPGATFSGPLIGGIYAVSEGPVTAILYEHTTAGTWALMALLATGSGSIFRTNRAIGAPWNTYITSNCRTAVTLARNRVIVSGSVRSFALDLYPNVVLILGPRDCGVYQTVLSNRTSTTGAADDPAHLGPNEHFSATSVLRYKFTDGYEIQSPPAVPGDYFNLSTTLPQIRSTWTIQQAFSVGINAETLVDVYRTRAQSVGYDTVSSKYKPIATGSSFYLSKTANSTGSPMGLLDTTLPSTLGEALLTNVSVAGASALPLPPPPGAKTACVFRGHAFYANYWDPATFTLLNPYYWGFMPMASATDAVLRYGIGIRYTNSGQSSTSGNPTVTGVPNTTGVQVGQTFNVYRVDTGVLVTSSNRVLSFTGTTITGDTNVSYTGSVRIELLDRIEICGSDRSAQSSPQAFIQQLFAAGVGQANLFLDVSAVGLEPVTTENPTNTYPNFVPTGGLTFRMRTNAPFTIRATNGANFSPVLPEIGSTVKTVPGRQQKNGFTWSENNEPENVPPSNYAFVGNGEIYKVVSTRDCLWFFCSDGLHRLSGSGGSVGDEYDWVIDPVDPSVVIANPMCAVTYREYVYALTNRGFVSVSSEGIVRELSDGRINPSWSFSSPAPALENKPWFEPFSAPAGGAWPWVAADEANDELWVKAQQGNIGSTDRIWVYNVKTDTWCIRYPSYNLAAPAGDELPFFGIYNSTAEIVLNVFNNSAQLVGSSEMGNTADYETAEVTFQPLYGGARTGAAYSQKHWQDINLSFRSPTSASIASNCTLRTNNEFGLIAGTRAIPASTGFGGINEQARIGFTIPRAFPAFSNTLQPYIAFTSPSITGPGVNLQPVKFEGFQVNYIETTDQRVRR